MNYIYILPFLLLLPVNKAKGAESTGQILVKCIIVPTSDDSEFYNISIFNDGKYSIMGYKRDSVTFENVYFDKEIVVSSKSMMELNKLIKQSRNCKTYRDDIEGYRDTWVVFMDVGENTYHFVYWRFNNKPLGNLLRLLMDLSPEEIYLHPWS